MFVEDVPRKPKDSAPTQGIYSHFSVSPIFSLENWIYTAFKKEKNKKKNKPNYPMVEIFMAGDRAEGNACAYHVDMCI